MPLTFEDVAKLQDVYRPTDERVVRELGSITLVPMVGPTAVGKNHSMDFLAKAFGYHQAGNLVSRELRPDDPPNVFHRDLSELLNDIENGELVQFAAQLGSRAIYATGIDNYQAGQINTKDIFSFSIEGFMRYGFRDVRPVCLVVSPEKWEPRLDKRFGSLTREQRASRLDEAAQSIQWIIEGSPEVDRVVVIGDLSHLDENIERIQSFVEFESKIPPEQVHYDTAEQMLKALPKLRKKYLIGE